MHDERLSISNDNDDQAHANVPHIVRLERSVIICQ